MALTDNLVSYCKFDENTGTTVGDSVGTNTGTFRGTLGSQWTTGIINSGLLFNGSDNNINIPSDASLDFTAGVSISAWIYKSNISANQDIVSKRSGWSSTGIPYELTNDGKIVAFRVIGNGNDLHSGDVFSLANINAWFHVVGTWNGTTQKIYLNGSEVASASVSGSITTNTTAINIGELPNGGENFTGKIDEVGIWSRGLSATEVTTLYNSGAGLAYPFSTGTNMQINIGDTFKTVTGIQINVSDTWKPVTKVQQNIGDVWKTVF